MSTYKAALYWGENTLRENGVSEYKLDAWYLMEHILERNRSWFFLHMEEEMENSAAKRFGELIERRSERIPLQYLTGTAFFMGLEFMVNEQVLIPRQDTEVLVEEGLKRLNRGAEILDVCTGSGCILLSLLQHGDNASGAGVDISPGALCVARENSRRLGLPAKFLESDLLESVEGTYDMIVSNPPYIPEGIICGLMEEVRDHEPRLALDGGADGLDFYRRISAEAGAYLKEEGWLLLEIGHDQGPAVGKMMKEAGYREVEIVQDLAGLDRVVVGKKYREEIHV